MNRGDQGEDKSTSWDTYRPRINACLASWRAAGFSDCGEFNALLWRVEPLDREYAIVRSLRRYAPSFSSQEAADFVMQTKYGCGCLSPTAYMRCREWLNANGFTASERVNRLRLEAKLNQDSRMERTAAGHRAVLLPPCTVKTEGYVPFSQAVYAIVPKEQINSMARIEVRDWEAGYSDLVSWIESRKVTLLGRRPGQGVNEIIPAEYLACQPIVDWTFELDLFRRPDGARRHFAEPQPKLPFLQCCYCSDFEYWQRGSTDQIFSTKHQLEWTHLQVNMTEVVVASKGATTRRQSPSAPPEAVAIDQELVRGRRADWTAPARLELAGWSQMPLSIAAGPSVVQSERWSIGLPETTKKALPASAGIDSKTEAQPPAKARRAGRSQYDWEDVAEFIRNRLKEHGEFRPWDIGSGWQGQADVERAVMDYMEKHHGGAPAESTVRLHVRKILTG